jgi:tRNA(Ile)-lysidine synthase
MADASGLTLPSPPEPPPGREAPAALAVLLRAFATLPPRPVLVALGGGADSAVLAWVAVRLGRPVRAATVDHGLPESPALIAAARALAAELGIPHRVLPCRAAGTSEAALRIARYSALEAEATPGEVLATGHTGDDQAETVLGNLLRGSGAVGLAGIPARRGRWCRPLLGLSREEARAAADELHLPYADDPGNEDLSRRRNVLRHEVLPLLEQRLGPGVREALGRAAALLAADDGELEARAGAVPIRATSRGVLLPAAALVTLPPPVASRVVRRALRMVLDPYPGHRRDVEAVLSVAGNRPWTALPLQGGNLAVRDGPWVVLRPAGGGASLEPVALPVPGRTHFGPWWLQAEAAGAASGPAPVGRRSALLDATAAGGGLTVRAAVAGDRIDRGAGHKPVFEALREAGVPAGRRRGWPVVVSGGTIAWVPGARLAAWAAPHGPEVVRLSCGEAE